MKTLKISLLLLLTLSVFTACLNGKAKLQNSIQEKESRLSQPGLPDTTTISKLIVDYEQFAKKYPDDTLSPEYLYRAASWANSINKAHKSIEIYNKILADYSDWEKIPETVFTLGFTYDNYLDDYVSANKMYNLFLSKYPDHELAKDVEGLLYYLGKSPEEMILDFERKNQEAIENE
ncbi:MAG: tetratricopeptide repeat protein [Bacteroidales bacterium]|jgi:tetratricopeptide (TPR) repeat protein